MYALDGTATTLSELFAAITTVVTSILTLFGSVAETLMSNVLFQVTLGIVMLSVVMGLVFYLVKKIKRRGR